MFDHFFIHVGQIGSLNEEILKLKLICHSFDIKVVSTLDLAIAITLVDALTAHLKGLMSFEV